MLASWVNLQWGWTKSYQVEQNRVKKTNKYTLIAWQRYVNVGWQLYRWPIVGVDDCITWEQLVLGETFFSISLLKNMWKIQNTRKAGEGGFEEVFRISAFTLILRGVRVDLSSHLDCKKILQRLYWYPCERRTVGEDLPWLALK